jgi:hypothetical protein
MRNAREFLSKLPVGVMWGARFHALRVKISISP